MEKKMKRKNPKTKQLFCLQLDSVGIKHHLSDIRYFMR